MMTSKPEAENNPIVEAAFQKARRIPISPPPFLETRVLAGLRERQHKSRKLVFWQTIAVFSAAFSLFVVSRDWLRSTRELAPYRAQIQQATLVSVEVQPLESSQIAFAEIDLPEGVTFFSKAHPELAGQRNLTIPWSPETGKSRFPFAIRGDNTGIQTVYVRFRDNQGTLLVEKALNIRFSEG